MDKYITNQPLEGALYTMRVLCIGVFVLTLLGCSDTNSDLQTYIRSVKAKPAGRIAPVPEFKPYETFTYSDTDLRDPFSVITDEDNVNSSNSELALRPDMNRNKEALEEYPLDTLHFVGHLEKGDERWAIITSPDHLVYRVKVGNHLGSNYGEIVAISETQIDIKEIIEDGLGGWIERDAALSLTE